MKRITLALLFLVSPLLMAASKPLTPGVYVVKPCPPAVVCPPQVTCPEAVPCPTCPVPAETGTNPAPLVSLQPVQPDPVGTDLRLGAADPVADPARPQANWRPSGWRFWAVTGGALVLGAVIEHQYDDDGSSYDHHEGRHPYDPPYPDAPPCHGPPGWCKNH